MSCLALVEKSAPVSGQSDAFESDPGLLAAVVDGDRVAIVDPDDLGGEGLCEGREARDKQTEGEPYVPHHPNKNRKQIIFQSVFSSRRDYTNRRRPFFVGVHA